MRMQIGIVAGLIGSCFAVAVMAKAEQDSLTLGVAQTHALAISAQTQVMIGDESLLQARIVSRNQLLLKAIAPGYTDLWLLTDKPRRIQVTITAPVAGKLKLALEAIKANEPGLVLESAENFVIASGEVTATSATELGLLVNEYPQLLDQTQVIATDQPMLRLNVKIIEVKRQQLHQLGIEWQSVTTGPTAGTAIKGIFNWSPVLSSTLNLLQQQGHAKLLATPTLSAQSGESAAFLAGGEIPIPQVVGQGLQDVSFREYGIKLTIAPEVTATGKIKTQLMAEVSNIDPAVTVNGVPGILTRRTDSVFLANEGDTLVLSGLLSHEQSRNESQLPLVGDIPVVGGLFSAQEQRELQTELLIMVTTERLDAADKRQQQLKQRQQQHSDWLSVAGCVGLMEVVDD